MQDFAVGNDVMISASKKFPVGTLKKLHARHTSPYIIVKKLGSNDYKLVNPYSLRINPVSNIKDLTSYRAPFDYPAIIFDLPSSTSQNKPFPIRTRTPLALQRHRLDKIEDILDDEIISTTKANTNVIS